MLKNCAVLAAIVSLATTGAVAVAGPAQASVVKASTTTTQSTAVALPSSPTRGGIYPNDSCWD